VWRRNKQGVLHSFFPSRPAGNGNCHLGIKGAINSSWSLHKKDASERAGDLAAIQNTVPNPLNPACVPCTIIPGKPSRYRSQTSSPTITQPPPPSPSHHNSSKPPTAAATAPATAPTTAAFPPRTDTTPPETTTAFAGADADGPGPTAAFVFTSTTSALAFAVGRVSALIVIACGPGPL